MVTSIRLGDVFVLDINQNNFFDPKSDVVTDAQGNVLESREKARALGSVLEEMGRNSWGGILLNHAGEFFQKIREAETAAEAGDWNNTSIALTQAQTFRESFVGIWNKSRAEKIIKRALSRGVEVNFKKAETVADQAGNPEEVRDYLDDAGRHARELTLLFKIPNKFDPARAGLILEKAFRNKTDQLWDQAQRSAQVGDIQETGSCVILIQYYSQEAMTLLGIQVGPTIHETNRAMAEALVAGLPKEYDRAEQQAKLGNTAITRRLLKYIEDLVNEGYQKYGLNVPFEKQRADEILEEALIEGVEDNFKLAWKYMLVGKIDRAELWLDRGRDYVAEYNRDHVPHNGKRALSFDENRARWILNYQPKHP